MIYEKILTENNYNKLYQVITGVDFPWYYQPDIAFLNFNGHTKDAKAFPSFGFTHTVWDTERGKVSELISLMGPIVENFQHQANIKINNFLRIKINLQVPVIGNKPEMYNGAHIDGFKEHQTLIYYLNDSDGDTVIFDKMYSKGDDYQKNSSMSLPIKQRIKPVANTLLHIDGFQYHSGSNPINTNTRITINFNFN
jgi:hypothetical protein